MDTNVKLEDKCRRCGKKDEQSMSLDAAKAELTRRTEREIADSTLQENLAHTLSSLEPDIIIAVRDENTGEYAIKTMDRDQLCHSPDAKRQKGCRNTVANILESLFLEPKKGRTPKKKETNGKED